MDKYVLQSGNIVYYRPYCKGEVEYLDTVFVVDSNFNFIGGMLGNNAVNYIRKISTYPNIISERNVKTIFPEQLSFVKWLANYPRIAYFDDYLLYCISDGDAGKAAVNACSRRNDYWRQSGLKQLITNDSYFVQVFMVIANHIYLYSNANFIETFFHSKNIEGAANNSVSFTFNGRHFSFYAPVIYLIRGGRNSSVKSSIGW